MAAAATAAAAAVLVEEVVGSWGAEVTGDMGTEVGESGTGDSQPDTTTDDALNCHFDIDIMKAG